jgi:MFS family permease
MDQFGWTEEETVLYFGILISSTGVMCVFLFAIVGPLSKRFDERKLLIFIGISTMFLGRLVVFPIPGNDPPPIANDTQNLGLRHPMSTIVSGSPNWYYPGQHRAPSQYLSSCKLKKNS